MDSKNLGCLTEQRCYLKCLEYGYSISKPLFDNERYDFILDTGKQLLKIQVKTSRWKDENHSRFSFNGYSQHLNGEGYKRIKYTNKEIDYFMTEKEGQFYLYPAPEVGFVEKSLRVLPTENGQQKNITFAKDYLFEEVIKSF